MKGQDQAQEPVVPAKSEGHDASTGDDEDEGRKAEDIPEEEIKASIKQAEVGRTPGG